MDKYTQIGQLKKPFGVKGFLKVDIEGQYLAVFSELEVLFIPEHGSPVPFFVETIKEDKGLLLKLEDVDSPEMAKKLSNLPVLANSDHLPKKGDLTLDATLIGFELHDEEMGGIGTIIAIEEYPQQLMAIVEKAEEEFLIPLHEKLILGIDPEAQVILMDLPKGLLDI